MRTYFRNYSEEKGDFNSICDFFIVHNKYLSKFSAFSIQRFIDWKYGLYRNRTIVANFWSRNAVLWFDGLDKLAGIFISENGGTDFNIITSPGHRMLFPGILKWVLNNRGQTGKEFFTEVTENQGYEIDCLLKNGFEMDFNFFKREFDLEGEIKSINPLDEGYCFVDMKNNPEYRQQRILRAEAFEGIKEISEEELVYQLEFYNNTHNSPAYYPYTDICIKSSEGKHVSGCEALLNPWYCEAEIERVCTHSEYRKMGFAKQVILECLRRLKGIGYKKAYITGYSKEAIKLYGSLGAENELKLHGLKR